MRAPYFFGLIALLASVAYAGEVRVTLDTSLLVGSAAGTFTVGFQLADGSLSGDGNNAVVLSNFQFGGGRPLGNPCGSPNAVSAGATGDISSSVTLSDLSVFSYCQEFFTAGSTLSFDLSYTNNVETGVADEFVMVICDKNYQPIPTTGGIALVEIDFDSANPAIHVFQGDPTQSEPANGGSGIPIPAPVIVGLTPPPAPTLISPANGATGVSLAPTLAWTPSTGATAYGIYFGTTNPPPFANTIPGTTASGEEAFNTTYYWQVTAINAGGESTPSPVSSFTTVAGGAQPDYVFPGSGSNGRQVFTFRARDPLGSSAIQYAQFLFSKSGISALNACYISYDPVANVFYLLSDDETQWYGLFGGSNQTTGNAQCEIHGATSGSSQSGTDLTMSVDLSFRSGFAGNKNIYEFAGDTQGNGSGWIQFGTWSDTGDANVIEVSSVSPLPGSGATQTLTATLNDASGANTIAFAQFVMNTTLNGYNACFIHYDQASNVFFLLDDTGTQWLGLFAGSATQVSNSQCTLHGVGSGGNVSGSTLTITYALDFAPGFTGTKQVYMQAVDAAGNLEVWHGEGADTP